MKTSLLHERSQLPQGEIVIYPDAEALTEAAAGEFVRLAAASIAAWGRFTVALSGGSTPRAMYSKLASWDDSSAAGSGGEAIATPSAGPETDPASSNPTKALSRSGGGGAIPWDSIYCFFGDERCVPPDHPDSNFGMARATLFSKVPIPPDHLHRIKTELEGTAAADDYEAAIKSFFGLGPGQFPRWDLVLLGLGTDGHVASLFPGTAALDESCRCVTLNRVPQLAADRITLTFPVLNAARQIVLLVSGEAKAKVLREVLVSSESDLTYPAQRVRPAQGRVVWMLDKAAASRLSATSTEA